MITEFFTSGALRCVHRTLLLLLCPACRPASCAGCAAWAAGLPELLITTAPISCCSRTQARRLSCRHRTSAHCAPAIGM